MGKTTKKEKGKDLAAPSSSKDVGKYVIINRNVNNKEEVDISLLKELLKMLYCVQ